jgi:hypothetical protein
MKLSRFLSIFVLLLVCSSEAFGLQFERTVFRFMNLPLSARASALGGFVNSLPDPDVSLAQLNPAYLAHSPSKELSLGYLNHLADINFANASFSLETQRFGMLSASVRYLNYGTIEETSITGEQTGTILAYDAALTLNWATKLDERWSVGVSSDIIRASYADVASTAVGFNGGLLYVAEDGMTSAALTLHNVGVHLSNFTSSGISLFNPDNEPLPFDARLGVSRKLLYLPLRLNLTAHSLHVWDMRTNLDLEQPTPIDNLLRHIIIGGEFLFSENFVVRLGYDHFRNANLKTSEQFDAAGMSFGVGIKVKSIHVNLARNSYSDIGGRTQIGLRTTF